MGKRRRSRHGGNWWTRSTGGVVHWLAVVTVAACAIGVGVAFRISPDQPRPVASGAYTSLPIASPSPTDSTPRRVPISKVQASGDRDAPLAFIIGDSYSEGYGATSPATDGYVPLLSDATGWATEVVSVPGGGYTKAGTRENGPFSRTLKDADLAGISPDVVIIQGGINEPGTEPAVMRAAVKGAIGTVREEMPNVPIIIVGLLQPEGPGPDYAQRVRQAMRAAVDSTDNAAFIDTETLSYPVIGDGVHPNSDGYAKIAETIIFQLRALGVTA